MRNIYSFLILFMSLKTLAADTIRAPKFDFSGTRVAWFHRPIEVNKVKQVGNIIKLEQLFQNFPPIVINNRIFYLLDNADLFDQAGSTLIAYDLENGDSLWQNNYNRHFNRYGLTVFWDFRAQGHHLEIFGYSTIDTTYRNLKNYYTGFTTRKIINVDGQDVYEYVNRDPAYLTTFQSSVPPHYLDGGDFAFFYQNYGPIDTLHSHGAFPHIWNDSLVPRSLDDKNILFKEPNATNFWIEGPTQLDAFTYVYFAKFYDARTGIFKHYMWTTDAIGNYRDMKDVSSLIGGPQLDQFIMDYEAVGDLIRLKIYTPFRPYRQGNVGYLYLDRHGVIVKDQRALQFDGKHVGHIASVNLKDSNQILHVMRFYEENNIHFYKELSNGQFIKCGEMIHNGDPKFAFLPKFVKQADNRDIILTFESALDSILYGENFVEGGWPYICKIEARELGFITHSIEEANAKLQIFPNPIHHSLMILGPLASPDYILRLQDIHGHVLQVSSKIIENGLELDFRSYQDGIYFLRLFDKNNRTILHKKLIKISTLKQ